MLLTLMWKNVRTRRTRSLLTALGVGVSIAAIIALTTVAGTLKQDLRAAATITGGDLLAVQSGVTGPTGSLIDESYVDYFSEKYEMVTRSTGFLLENLLFSDTSGLNLFGIRLEDSDMYLGDDQIIAGVHVRGPGEIGLGKLASAILDTDLGGTVQFGSGDEFEVVGIYETGNSYLDSGGMVALDQAQAVTNLDGRVTMISLDVAPEADIEQLALQIEADVPGLKTMPPKDVVESSSGMNTVDTFAWVFSFIALFTGGIAVLNIMSISVSERTREIGVLRAIGWRRTKILRMILGESLILSLGGFVIGSLMAIVTIHAIPYLPNVGGIVNPSLVGDPFVVGLAVSLILGLLGGAYPAYKASRLSPMEAMHHE